MTDVMWDMMIIQFHCEACSHQEPPLVQEEGTTERVTLASANREVFLRLKGRWNFSSCFGKETNSRTPLSWLRILKKGRDTWNLVFSYQHQTTPGCFRNANSRAHLHLVTQNCWSGTPEITRWFLFALKLSTQGAHDRRERKVREFIFWKSEWKDQ